MRSSWCHNQLVLAGAETEVANRKNRGRLTKRNIKHAKAGLVLAGTRFDERWFPGAARIHFSNSRLPGGTAWALFRQRFGTSKLEDKISR
jgi:hypothetical protein